MKMAIYRELSKPLFGSWLRHDGYQLIEFVSKGTFRDIRKVIRIHEKWQEVWYFLDLDPVTFVDGYVRSKFIGTREFFIRVYCLKNNVWRKDAAHNPVGQEHLQQYYDKIANGAVL